MALLSGSNEFVAAVGCCGCCWELSNSTPERQEASDGDSLSPMLLQCEWNCAEESRGSGASNVLAMSSERVALGVLSTAWGLCRTPDELLDWGWVFDVDASSSLAADLEGSIPPLMMILHSVAAFNVEPVPTAPKNACPRPGNSETGNCSTNTFRMNSLWHAAQAERCSKGLVLDHFPQPVELQSLQHPKA